MSPKPKHFKKFVLLISVVIIVEFVLLFTFLTRGRTVAILQPAGTIAEQQRDLIIFASVLGLLVIIPVFVLLGFILWRYRDGNVKAKYRPNWDGSAKLETLWWGIPIFIILILAVVTWKTSHSLDPYRPLESTAKPLRIQVIALQWKWLFIYPEQQIASVNYLQIPEDTPINFEITSDAPMNSFWIPQLGGQVYAMSGMTTKLHLMADETGSYSGVSANISGEGFAGMKFTVDSTSKESFESWTEQVAGGSNELTQASYKKLAEPSSNEPVTLFATSETGLYDSVIHRYMSHDSNVAENSEHYMEGMAH